MEYFSFASTAVAINGNKNTNTVVNGLRFL